MSQIDSRLLWNDFVVQGYIDGINGVKLADLLKTEYVMRRCLGKSFKNESQRIDDGQISCVSYTSNMPVDIDGVSVNVSLATFRIAGDSLLVTKNRCAISGDLYFHCPSVW